MVELERVEQLRRLIDRARRVAEASKAEPTNLIQLRADLTGCLTDFEAHLLAEGLPDSPIPDRQRAELTALLIRLLTLHERLLDALDALDSRLFGALHGLFERHGGDGRACPAETLVESVYEVTRTPVYCVAVASGIGTIIAAQGIGDNVGRRCIVPLESVEDSAIQCSHPVSSAATSIACPDLNADRDDCVVAIRVADGVVLVSFGARAQTGDHVAYLALVQQLVLVAKENDDSDRGRENLVKRVTGELHVDIDPRIIDPDPRPTPWPTSLTRREREILQLVLLGLSNSDIASDLVISVETAKSHVKSILRKCGAANRAELINRLASA
ncbi:MAG TPA: helix-turn-helix transcriptional regulator [Aldersonia sp.]